MQLFGFDFRPKVWSTVLTLVIVALFVDLGIWQWHRYQYKKTIQQDFAVRAQLTSQPLQSVLKQFQNSPDRLRFRAVVVQGVYDQRQFLWDNRIVNEQVGYDVFTPLKLDDHTAILVDRGFVPANAMREVVQNIDAPADTLEVKGLLTEPSKNFILGAMIEPDAVKWPQKVLRVDPKVLSPQLGYTLLPYIILLSPDQAHGFVRQWQMPNMMAERSLGYAFQWMAFAITLIIIYLVMNCRRK